MRKIIVLSIVCMLFVLSCTISEKAVFDESVPIEDSAWISESNVGKIVGYNGISVDWDLGLAGTARIPAGDTLLEWNIKGPVLYLDQVVYGTIVNLVGEGILFRFNFQPQMLYSFIITEVNDEYGLDVFAYGYEEKVSGGWKSMKEHWVGFTPFLNTGDNAGKTVLN